MEFMTRLGWRWEGVWECFYADVGLIGSRDPEWLQGALNVLIRLLRRVGKMPNVAKSNNTI